jgi:hypothetical protein
MPGPAVEYVLGDLGREVPGRPERRGIARPKRAARRAGLHKRVPGFPALEIGDSAEDRGNRSGRRRHRPALHPGAREGRSPLAPCEK